MEEEDFPLARCPALQCIAEDRHRAGRRGSGEEHRQEQCGEDAAGHAWSGKGGGTLQDTCFPRGGQALAAPRRRLMLTKRIGWFAAACLFALGPGERETASRFGA